MGVNSRSRVKGGLSAFEGKTVLSVGVTVRNAGGGLNKALSVDPAEWHQGDRVVVVLDCEVDKVRFDRVKDSDGVQRVHILVADGATIVERDLVADVLDAQERRLEEAAGIHRLPMGEDDEQNDADV
jgi:hypothetical protein